MSPAEYTRRVEQIAAAADAAIEDAGKRDSRILDVLRRQMVKVDQRRLRAAKVRQPFTRDRLLREAQLIETVIEAVGKVL